jgi:hypothetical protein
VSLSHGCSVDVAPARDASGDAIRTFAHGADVGRTLYKPSYSDSRSKHVLGNNFHAHGGIARDKTPFEDPAPLDEDCRMVLDRGKRRRTAQFR